jgi:hypothetical protein
VGFYNKLNANERLAAIGAVVVIVSWIVGLVGASGLGGGTITLLCAIGVLAVYYLKYSPTQNVNWPAPIPLIVLALAGLAALLAAIAVLQMLGLGALGSLLGLYSLAVIGTAVGAGIMVWGAWQEYQAMPKTTPPSSPNPPGA